MTALQLPNNAMKWLTASIMFVLLTLPVSRIVQAAGVDANAGTVATTMRDLENVPVELSPSEEKEVDSMVLPVPPNWIGDLDGMRERHLIRILVPYSKTFFYVDRGQQKGIEYEIGKALEKWLDTRMPVADKHQSWRVIFIPVKRDQLITDLLAGRGDIATGGLTTTKGRQQIIDFADPFARNIKEVLITGPGSSGKKKIEDMAGQEIMVRPSSSYFEHLVELNAKFKEKGIEPIKIIPADEWLESEDLLEMVNAGLIKATIVDNYLAKIWQPLFTDLKIHDSFSIYQTGNMAWAIRKGSPKLQVELKTFVQQHKIGTTFGNIIKNRYVKNQERVKNSTSELEMRKFKKLVKFFQEHGKTYDFDYLMLMAQGYQESQLNQQAKSSRGAVGIMQLLPSTAADPAIGIKGIDKDAWRNIEAGSKYMRLLADKYLNDPELTSMNRTLMSFAAYNAGPGNLRKFRRLAEKSGKNPNIWFENVEYAAARIVGQETVGYVDNIYKYYIAYKLAEKKSQSKNRAKKY